MKRVIALTHYSLSTLCYFESKWLVFLLMQEPFPMGTNIRTRPVRPQAASPENNGQVSSSTSAKGEEPNGADSSSGSSKDSECSLLYQALTVNAVSDWEDFIHPISVYQGWPDYPFLLWRSSFVNQCISELQFLDYFTVFIEIFVSTPDMSMENRLKKLQILGSPLLTKLYKYHDVQMCLGLHDSEDLCCSQFWILMFPCNFTPFAAQLTECDMFKYSIHTIFQLPFVFGNEMHHPVFVVALNSCL